MSPKMKGLFKGFKYFSQIFVYREQEMQIGYPTDVKHVAHIGWDGDSMNTPSWMNEFKTAPEFSSASLNSFGTPRDKSRDTIASWASEDFKKPEELLQQANDLFVDSPTGRDLPAVSKPGKRKKQKSSPALRTPKQPKSKNLVANAAC